MLRPVKPGLHQNGVAGDHPVSARPAGQRDDRVAVPGGHDDGVQRRDRLAQRERAGRPPAAGRGRIGEQHLVPLAAAGGDPDQAARRAADRGQRGPGRGRAGQGLPGGTVEPAHRHGAADGPGERQVASAGRQRHRIALWQPDRLGRGRAGPAAGHRGIGAEHGVLGGADDREAALAARHPQRLVGGIVGGGRGGHAGRQPAALPAVGDGLHRAVGAAPEHDRVVVADEDPRLAGPGGRRGEHDVAPGQGQRGPAVGDRRLPAGLGDHAGQRAVGVGGRVGVVAERQAGQLIAAGGLPDQAHEQALGVVAGADRGQRAAGPGVAERGGGDHRAARRDLVHGGEHGGGVPGLPGGGGATAVRAGVLGRLLGRIAQHQRAAIRAVDPGQGRGLGVADRRAAAQLALGLGVAERGGVAPDVGPLRQRPAGRHLLAPGGLHARAGPVAPGISPVDGAAAAALVAEHQPAAVLGGDRPALARRGVGDLPELVRHRGVGGGTRLAARGHQPVPAAAECQRVHRGGQRLVAAELVAALDLDPVRVQRPAEPGLAGRAGQVPAGHGLVHGGAVVGQRERPVRAGEPGQRGDRDGEPQRAVVEVHRVPKVVQRQHPGQSSLSAKVSSSISWVGTGR